MPGRESATGVRGTPAEGLATGQVDVTGSATEIIATRHGRRSLLVVNHGSVDVFLGNASVTAATGVLLAGTKGQGIVMNHDEAIYGITASGSQKVSFIELF